ncbi:hypothetical protein [Roseateles sp. BYS87W]|uniref:Uncharacterized protein n=1 Tax=Pelomonas baiyunensis TaxID=3299026 RepID=A0ABW7GTK4_9BURK
MLHTLLASLGLAVCIALAVHMALPYRAQRWVDTQARRAWNTVKQPGVRLAGWWRERRDTRAAAAEADRVIRRARESALHDARDSRVDGVWEGNVYRPKNFEKPKKPH